MRVRTVPLEAASAPGAPDLRLPRLTDARYKAVLRDIVRDVAMDDRGGRFPGPNPVSLDRGTLGRLMAEPYYVCEKTDGVRCALVCCAVDDPRR